MTVLIALAAILVPLLPSMLSRGHDTSSATNISEISKYVQTYNQLYFGYPNYLDNLIEAGGTGGGTGGGTLLGTLAGGGNLAGMVAPQQLTLAQATALNNIGINYLANLTGTAPSGTANPNWSPTFSPYTTMAPNQPTNATAITSTNLPYVAVLTGTTTVGATPAAGTGVSIAVSKLGLSLFGHLRRPRLRAGQQCHWTGCSGMPSPFPRPADRQPVRATTSCYRPAFQSFRPGGQWVQQRHVMRGRMPPR